MVYKSLHAFINPSFEPIHTISSLLIFFPKAEEFFPAKMSPAQNDRHLLEDEEEVALEGTKQKHQQNQKRNDAAENDGESETGWLSKKSAIQKAKKRKMTREEVEEEEVDDNDEQDEDDEEEESDGGGWGARSSRRKEKKKKATGWGWKKQERKKDHWKLVMMRKIQAITFRFSDRCSCASLLFEDKDKQMVHKDGSVSTRIRLCEECVDLNIEANDAIGKFYEKKKYGGGKN